MLERHKHKYQEYIESNTIWTATLSNGDTWFSYEINDISPWIELQNLCNATNQYITDMSISFRNHVKTLPSNQDGYFFCKSVLGSLGMTKSSHYFVVGYVRDSVVHVTKWSVPALLKQYDEIRTVEQCKECLIWKK